MGETLATYTIDCTQCYGEKGYLQLVNGHEYWITCECYKQAQEKKQLLDLFKSARVPKRYMHKTLDNFNQSRQPKAFNIVETYLKNWDAIRHNGGGLIFVGDVGSGKTHLAFALLGEILKKGAKGLAATVPDLMDDLRPKKGETTDKQESQIETLKKIDFVVLDDLGAQRNTEWVTERLFIIINARYNNMLPTIITSNETLESLEKLLGWKRIVDRIVEMNSIVLMDGESYRLEKAKGEAENR
ncbi:MAG: DNA replication protein DnaC [Syntrophomonadaceae bacterium]|nr:DNA replication protein DnaC [Bacillota bacterium]